MMRNSGILTLAVALAVGGCSAYHAANDSGNPENTSTAMNAPQDLGYGAPGNNQAINNQGNVRAVTPKQADQQPAAIQNTPAMNSASNTASYNSSSGLNNASAGPSDHSTAPPLASNSQMSPQNQVAQNSESSAPQSAIPSGNLENASGTPNVTQSPRQSTNSANPSLGPNPAGVNPGDTLSAADQQFLTDAFGGGQYEIATSQKALAKSQNTGVKNIAQHMIDDHSKADDQLTDLATSKGDHDLGGMNADEINQLAQLDKYNGGEFDSQYLQQQQTAHQKTIAEFQQEAKSADDPQVRQWAATTLPTLQEHLNMINEQLSPNIGSER